MRSRIFWKIFLPFWITQTFIVLFLAYRIHVSFGPERPWWVQPERRAMPVLARAAVWRYSNRAQEGLRDLLSSINLAQRSEYWFFDSNLNELSGFPIPPGTKEEVTRSLAQNGISRGRAGTVLAERVDDGKGHQYIFAGKFFFPPVLHSLPAGVFFSILASTLLTSLVCAILAQYITSPIVRLRDAAAEIARGHLEARAGMSDSKRKDEIADLVEDFDHMAKEIQDLVLSNKRMLMGASHDLRSPIARMRIALSLVAGAHNEDERKEMLERIELELLRLNGMIEQILTAARLESGQIEPNLAPVLLNQVIDEAVEDARFEASQSSVEISWEPSDRDIQVLGAENILRSAVENVLRNAIFYAGEGGRVSVEISADGKTARIWVRDNGPGVPQESLAELFKPFYRVDDARVSTTGGTGLGLSIVQRAVAMHRGTVVARNLSPHGLEILMELPDATNVRATSAAEVRV